MNQAAPPHLDLAAPGVASSSIRLSLLEAELLLWAQLRGTESYGDLPSSAARPLDASGPQRPSVGYLSAGPSTVKADTPPCTEFEDNLGIFKSVHLIALDKLSGIPFDRFFEHIGVGAVGKFGITKSLALLQILTATTVPSLTVSVAPAKQHWSHDGVQNEATWTASAWVPDHSIGQGAEEKAVRDCLETFGFPGSDTKLHDSMSDWKVAWDASGLGKHGTWGLAKNAFYLIGSQVMHVDDSGEARLVVDMTDEAAGAHAHGIPHTDTATVAAHLDVSAPDATPFLKAAIGDLPEAVMLILGEAYKSWSGPTKSADLEVHWHEPGEVRVELQASITGAYGFSSTFAGSALLTIDEDDKLAGDAALTVQTIVGTSACGSTFEYFNPRLRISGSYNEKTQLVTLAEVRMTADDVLNTFVCGGRTCVSSAAAGGNTCGSSSGAPQPPANLAVAFSALPGLPLSDGAVAMLPRYPGLPSDLKWDGKVTLHYQKGN
jgi:hypothetical protein